MSIYRLDRTVFKAQTANEASHHADYYKRLTWQERLGITSYLNSIAYNYPQNKPPRIDKTKFKPKARNI